MFWWTSLTKTAFIHDWVLPGGALSVFEELIKETFTTSNNVKLEEYKIFTLTSDRAFLNIEWVGKIRIITVLPKWLNSIFQYFSFHKVPVLSFFCDYRNLMFFYPYLMKKLSRKLKKSWVKNIVISSFAIAKNIDLPIGSTSLLYLHSPMQYIWSHHVDYLKKLSGIKLKLFKIITSRLRKRDLKYKQYDTVQANSKYTAKLAKELYAIDAKITYPKVVDAFFLEDINTKPSNYYVFLWRLTKLVRETDTIIKLFNTVKLPLFVIWSGPDELELKTLAGETIIFLWRIKDEQEKINILKNAKGLINLTKESFGLNTAEALLLWVPVFGLNDGASPELVDQDCGMLIDQKNFDHVDQKFLEFVNKDWNRKQIAKHTRALLKH